MLKLKEIGQIVFIIIIISDSEEDILSIIL